MLGGDTVELKAVITLDMLVLQPVCEPVIINVSEEPADLKKLPADTWDRGLYCSAWGYLVEYCQEISYHCG